MSNSPLNDYLSVQKNTLEGRDLEASVIDLATQKLLAAQQIMMESNNPSALDEALRFNQKVWTFFQAEMLDAENPMPIEIKQNILTLISFIDKHTFMIMADPSPDKLDALININRNIASGLRHQELEINTNKTT